MNKMSFWKNLGNRDGAQLRCDPKFRSLRSSTSRWIYASLVMGILLMSAHVCAAQSLIVKAYVDQNFVSIGQQFVLTLEISGADAQSAPVPDPPDISAFADFSGNSSSSNMQIINGRMSVSKSSINYYLARTEGKHQIPAVVLNFKGKSYHSEPITIEVSKGGTGPSAQGRQPSQRPSQLEPEGELEGNLYLVGEPDRKTVYQNEPVIVTYKIYTRVDVSSYSLSKMPDLIGFWSEEFELPQQPSTHEENVDGKRFLVAEVKKLALFPTDAGEKVIEPMEVDCDVRLRQRRRGRDLFDSFFFDDRDIFGKRVRARIASEPIE
ncbi:MAG: BatD family protein, partial [bacterium]